MTADPRPTPSAAALKAARQLEADMANTETLEDGIALAAIALDAFAASQREQVERERDEARDWVRKMHRETQILTCVYCGEAYPPGTPNSGSEALTAHVEQCEKHPLRAARAEVERLRAAVIDVLKHPMIEHRSELMWVRESLRAALAIASEALGGGDAV